MPPRTRRVITYNLTSANARDAFEEELDLEEEAQQQRAQQSGSRRGGGSSRRGRGSSAFSLHADLPNRMLRHDFDGEHEGMHEYDTPKQTADMLNLMELFGATGLDREVIEGVYFEVNCNFEVAMERLMELGQGSAGAPVQPAPIAGAVPTDSSVLPPNSIAAAAGGGPAATAPSAPATIAASASASASAASATATNPATASTSAPGPYNGDAQDDTCHWDTLPSDVKRHVFTFLSSRDVARAARTCRDFADPARHMRTNTRQLQIPTGLGMHGIMALVGAFVNARAVSLRQWATTPLTDGDFTALVVALSAGSRHERRATPVEALSFKGCRWLTDGHVLTMCHTMQHLKEVDLTDCVGITDAALLALSKYHRIREDQDGGGDSSDDETMTLDDLEAAKAAAAAAAAAAASTSAAAATPPLPPRRGSRSHRDTPQPTQAAERGALGEGSKAGRDREGEDDDDELQFEFEAAATPVAPAGLGAGGGGGVRGAGPGPISGGEEELPGVEGASSGDEEEEEEEGGPASRYRRAGRDAALGSNNSSSDEEEEVADLDGRSVDSVSVGSAKLASGLAAAFASAVAVSGGRRPSGGDAGSLSSSLKAAAGVPARPVRTASRNSGGGGGGGGGDSASSTPLHGTSPAVGGLLGTSFGAAGVTPSGARSWLYGSSPVMGASPFFRTGLAPSGGGGGASGGGVLGGAHNAWVARAASSATRKHSRGLMSINVSGCRAISADGVRALLAAPLPKTCLLQLDMSRCPRITRAALALPATSHLCLLRASACHNLHEVILQLPLTSPLTELHLADCKALTKLHVVAPALQLLHVGSCRHLTRLHVRCPQLRQLTASLCFRLHDLDVERWEVPRLERLNLFGCRHLQWPPLAQLLPRVPQLRHLDINGCNELVVVDIPTANVVLAHVDASGCKALLALRCPSPALAALAVRSCPRLEELRADNAMGLTRLDISNCPLLHRVSLPHLADQQQQHQQVGLHQQQQQQGGGGAEAGPGAAGGGRGAGVVVVAGQQGLAVRLAGCDRLPWNVMVRLKQLREAAREAARKAAAGGAAGTGVVGVVA